MKNAFRDFWIILLFCYGVIGLTFIRAEETALNKALVLVNEGRTDEAIDVLRQGIEKNPQEPDAQLLLGVAYLEKSEYELAKSALEKALSFKPDSTPAHYTLAMLFEKERKYPRAVTEWKKVYQLARDGNLKELANKHIRQLEGIR